MHTYIIYRRSRSKLDIDILLFAVKTVYKNLTQQHIFSGMISSSCFTSDTCLVTVKPHEHHNLVNFMSPLIRGGSRHIHKGKMGGGALFL